MMGAMGVWDGTEEMGRSVCTWNRMMLCDPICVRVMCRDVEICEMDVRSNILGICELANGSYPDPRSAAVLEVTSSSRVQSGNSGFLNCTCGSIL